MGSKKIAELQPGDIIYKVLDDGIYYVPKILECKVDRVVANGGLEFPEHCKVFYTDPREPDKINSAALGGNCTCSYNGALYYSVKEEGYARWTESAIKAKESLTKERDNYERMLKELSEDWNSRWNL